jgi:hypothetical protein
LSRWIAHPPLVRKPDGISAASWDEAAEYGRELYLVVPFLFDGDDPVIALGTRGWRSSAATVVAGPWDKYDKDGMRQAAEIILASYAQGYRQINGILIWAISIIGLPNMHVEDFLPLLEWGISEEDENLRLLAVRAAARIGESALPILERAMEDQSWLVRQDVVYAAAQLGPAALPILERGIEDEQWDVRVCAVFAASKIGAPAIHVLERAMADENPDVRREAHEAAVLLGYNPPPTDAGVVAQA